MSNNHGDHTVSNDLERSTPMRDEKTTTNHSADEEAVRALYREMMDGWNQGSGAAFAAVFAAFLVWGLSDWL